MEYVVGMAEAKSKLAELVGEAKYGNKTFVLQRRGQPMAVLIGIDEFERLQASATRSGNESFSSLPPALQRRQAALVVQARRLRERLGAPEVQLAEMFAELPPDDDEFWLETLEAI